MSEFDESTGENTPKALREAYDKLKAQHEADLKELASFRTAQRQGSVAEALKAKGLDEAKAKAAAKFYTADDTSTDAVGKWVEENAVLFGAPTAPQSDPNAEAAARVAGASFGSPEEVAVNDQKVTMGDPAEIMRLIQTLPYEELEKRGLMPKRGQLFVR